MSSVAIGIDLGTTNSCVGVKRNDRVEIIANDQGNRVTPSFVAFTEDEILVGDAAKAQAAGNPQNTVYDVKRLIGRKYGDAALQKMMDLWPFVVKNVGGNPAIEVECQGVRKTLTPEEISAMVLVKMKETAEAYVGGPVTDAVITVPAYFNDSQREATKGAGKIAGLNVLAVLNEPIAAAIAAGVEQDALRRRHVLVYDFSESSFDVAVVSVENNKMNVVSSDSNTDVNGDAIDDLLVAHFHKEFLRKHQVDATGNAKAMAKLRRASATARSNLSTSVKDTVQIESLFQGLSLNTSISRARLEGICSDIFGSTLELTDSVLENSLLTRADVDEVVLVGCVSRLPKVQTLLKEAFPGKRLTLSQEAAEVVACGASLEAARLAEAARAAARPKGTEVVENLQQRAEGAQARARAGRRAEARAQRATGRDVVHKVAIGIDLGTTNSCVGYVRNGHVEIIANDQGNRVTPSYVAFTEDEILVGDAAKAQVEQNPQNTVYDVKRLIGRKHSDPNVQKMIAQWPFQVLGVNDDPKVDVVYKNARKLLSPEEISALVLKKMKETAETYIGSPVTDAVITVPAYFNDSQRQATIDAGQIAGLNVLAILNEPTAAAIAYGVDKEMDGKKNVLIYDLGGGTFDVVVLTIEDGDFQVEAVSGDTYLGGGDFDNRLIEHFVKEYQRKKGVNLSGDLKAKAKLKTACERAKRLLSSSPKENVLIESLYNNDDFESSVSRGRFEELCKDLFENTLEPVKTVLEQAGLDQSEIHEVVLAGGSTRIPKIQELLQTFFRGKKLNKTINPDEAVAFGAALHAAVLSGDDTAGGFGLTDVCPLSLGLDVLEGYTYKIVERNTKIPTRRMTTFTTSFNNQPNVYVDVYEGERDKSVNNHLLGKFVLGNIQRAPAEVPQIEVTFDVDKNGILTVTAVDTNTGSHDSIRITSNKGRLDAGQISRMVVEARGYAADSAEAGLTAKARYQLEERCLEIRKTATRLMRRAGVGGATAGRIQVLAQACDEALQWLDDHQKATKAECDLKRLQLEALFAANARP